MAGGKLRLKTDLGITSDLPATVLAFRREHDLGPTCENLVEFARLVRTSRSEIYRSLLDALVKNLENSIPSMSREQQGELLRRSFPFINTGEVLSKIPTALLKRRSDIPVEYLNALALNPALADTLSKMPKGVQRQLWASDVGLRSFEAHLAVHLDRTARASGSGTWPTRAARPSKPPPCRRASGALSAGP